MYTSYIYAQEVIMTFQDSRIDEYIEALSSKAPVPGGGGVSALTGALASGLARMVCSLTVGKKKYAADEPEIIAIPEKLSFITEKLYACMKKDAEAFEPLSKAYGMPKDTEEQIAEKNRVMEKCLYEAALPPLEICTIITEMTGMIDTVRIKGSTLAVSDAGCSAALAEAAFKAAALNVMINTRLMKDRETAAQINEKLQFMEKNTLAALQDIYGAVYDKLDN